MPDPVITQAVMDANTITTVINNVNSMYSNVIAYTVGLVAFIGILLPVAISFFQNRQLKADHKALTDKISLEIQDAKKALFTDLKNQLAIEIVNFDIKTSDIKNEMSQNILELTSGLNAKAHHAQANDLISKNAFVNAFKDCVIATCGYSKSKYEPNLQKVIEILLLKQVLPKLKKLDFDGDDSLEIDFEKALASIEEVNTNSRYDLNIKLLKKEFKAAKARIG